MTHIVHWIVNRVGKNNNTLSELKLTSTYIILQPWQRRLMLVSQNAIFSYLSPSLISSFIFLPYYFSFLLTLCVDSGLQCIVFLWMSLCKKMKWKNKIQLYFMRDPSPQKFNMKFMDSVHYIHYKRYMRFAKYFLM